MLRTGKKNVVCLSISLFLMLFMMSWIEYPAAATGNVIVPNGKAIILGEQGKYILIDPPVALNEISVQEWDTPAGVYDRSSVLKISGIGYIGSISETEIGGIYADAEQSEVHILSGSHLNIKTTNENAISAYDLYISETDASEPTVLNAQGRKSGISHFGNLIAFHSSVTAEGEDYGIYCTNTDFYAPSQVFISHGSTLHTSANAENGIAVSGNRMRVIGSQVFANAPSGISGITMTSELTIESAEVHMKMISSEVEAFSKTGRAVTVGYTNVSGMISVKDSSLSGKTTEGEVGVHADSISAFSEDASAATTQIIGEANSGFGVVGQALDTDYEFPSGSIHIAEAKVVGNVKEGMGISSYILSAYGKNKKSILQGTADRGLGISVCSGYIEQAEISGTSKGASDKHYQVYDSIPDSAGINFLSYFMIGYGSIVTGNAPMEDINSYGIHGLLNDAEGVSRTAYLSIQQYAPERTVFMGEGGTGIYIGAEMQISQGDTADAIEIIAHGKVDGMQTSGVSIDSSSTERRLKIEAVGEQGAGIRSLPRLENTYNRLSVKNAQIKAVGKEYGIWYDVSENIHIENAEIKAEAYNGDGIKFLFHADNQVGNLELYDNIFIANGEQFGLVTENFNLQWASAYASVKNDYQFRGNECAIDVNYTDNTSMDQRKGIFAQASPSGRGETAKITIEAVSEQVAPDLMGRRPAVNAIAYKLNGSVELTETYLIPFSRQLSPEPYMAYAADQNILSFKNYVWDKSTAPVFASEIGLFTLNEIKTEESVIGFRAVDAPDEPVVAINGASHKIHLKNKAATYTVRFDPDGGEPKPLDQELLPGARIIEPKAPEKQGFDFAGWKDIGKEKKWDFSFDIMPNEDLFLVAEWTANQYTVTFNANTDKTVTGLPTPQTLAPGSLISEPEENPILSGADFLGWSDLPEGGRFWVFNQDVMPSHHLNLYAQWKTLGEGGGSGSEKPTNPGQPETGDSSKLWILILEMTLSILLLSSLCFIRKVRFKLRETNEKNK